jgi:hypothetical protein
MYGQAARAGGGVVIPLFPDRPAVDCALRTAELRAEGTLCLLEMGPEDLDAAVEMLQQLAFMAQFRACGARPRPPRQQGRV